MGCTCPPCPQGQYAATHLGFQFRDLQVQFIQVLVHECDERLKEAQGAEKTAGSATQEVALGACEDQQQRPGARGEVWASALVSHVVQGKEGQGRAKRQGER